tara:strand:- start:38 stop:280 length:243 start_codon:yes stop_codon:yes gene_type:complete
MFPVGTLINSNKKNLVVFEKDFNNPINEGFICLWKIKSIKSIKSKKLIFKKRLTKIKAINIWTMLIKEGWLYKENTENAA